MAEQILPDFVSFGDFPFDAFPDLQPFTAETALPLAPAPTPLGVDLGFDFGAGEFRFTPGGDLMIVSEEEAIQQWLVVALITPRGREIIYDYRFGSEISDLLGAGGLTDTMVSDAATFIREAILIHDRIVAVDNLKYSYTSTTREVLVFYFDVITDTDDRFQFGGLQVG